MKLNEAHSGADLDGRLRLLEIRDAIQRREVDGIVAWKFDRLSRKITHQTVITYEIERVGAEVYSVHEDFDNSPEGKLLRTTVGYVAEVERDNIKRRSIAGIHRYVESGKSWSHSIPAYGYLHTEDRTGYVLNPETAPIVRHIFEQVAAGVTLHQVCLWHHKEGLSSPYGRAAWSVIAIKRMLESSVYYEKSVRLRFMSVPRIRINRKTGREYLGTDRAKREGVPLPPCPAIVTEDLAKRALAAVKERRHKPIRKHPLDLVDGMIWCECGMKMRKGTRTDGKASSYLCTRGTTTPGATCYITISSERVEAKVWSLVIEAL